MLCFGGKLGAFFSAVLVVIIYYALEYRFSRFIFLVIVTMMISVGGYHFGILKTVPVFSKLNVNKLILEKHEQDIWHYRGRLQEIIKSTELFKDVWGCLLTGGGLGYSYKFELADGSVGLRHGVHFSPVSVLTIYGSVYFIMFYWYMIQSCYKGFRILSDRKASRISKFMSCIMLSIFLNSFTAYGIFYVLFFPVSIGMVNRKEHKMPLSHS
jgi:hypothetical protein